ncbi:aminotransferase class I/II-fold pyridoxal phosphate-dependent enzyme [Corynebacterium sanguinis]|uniref:cysteine-S-conjugate beta-lyase n=1 Tax=Corynebacterium sanguinis TaxID=2594913 RepID=A0A6I7R7Y3_9CORY|nr:aminotransferase class I/II-fold pyridoxal phosphate-dependent enzyme [Corynebacterium sanguinis]MBA4504572.1 aminotransferase class I/II-fold pyridoxal phosphate-dependent enzyme [Corynebacterium sanguinis]MCT1414160.1 aminotransferase class I/II-fold pyridoxal phosphate-dependent enzyme [Corynebacterium sanguinis]MCT1499862.1 aminotransferase class I/II-fold pyridoxal phosphate-dependent enzyme [Corynebacterium sanguinis]MCT1583989.1 aminotransferase class I/II-fold pyridoxal phosphate-dep
MEFPNLDTLKTRGTRKWTQYDDDVLPLWVAESDFPTAPVVKAALQQAVEAETFGYTPAPQAQELPKVLADFYESRYGWRPDEDKIFPVPDVVRGLLLAIMYFTEGDVIVPVPAYHPFLEIAETAGRNRVEVSSTGGLDLMEVEAAFRNGAGSIILTNPFNPGGWIFEEEELDQICAIARRYGGRVLVDEIHAPLVYDDHHVCAAKDNPDVCITVTATSKAFNVAGLKCAQMIFSNADDVTVFQGLTGVAKDGTGTLGIVAAEACYRDGAEFLDEEIELLRLNRDWLVENLPEKIPGITFEVPKATYLMFLDFSGTKLNSPRPAAYLLKHAKVALNEGASFGPGGEHKARLNFATSPAILEEAVDRIAEAVNAISR